MDKNGGKSYWLVLIHESDVKSYSVDEDISILLNDIEENFQNKVEEKTSKINNQNEKVEKRACSC